ncbi:hypothetical protein C7999DRAFT_44611 [Corynascus novoguineensis]|uniref:DUF7136 domain-containing protein n=1 Tax=Corynascus novoguineensis TaxID=1126955 RepID=A0AAN7CM68_9PEZI|nr:hypothetical protein C7999DRAFT_44611 [Corynascus novoguineensis]
MRLSSPAVWSFVTSLVCLYVVAEPAGVLEIDLVFPRNKTYEPTPYMPVVFGFHNGELVRRLRPDIVISILNKADPNNSEDYIERLVTVNWTSNEPNFVEIIDKHTTRLSSFVMKKGRKPVDLVAIIANNETCTDTLGIALNVTDATVYISPSNWSATVLASDPELETCVLVATSTPTPTTNPCLIKIDSLAAAAISASAKDKQCILDRTPDCPDQ